MAWSAAQQDALKFIDTATPSISAWTSTIFGFGETAWREYQSAEWYCDRLEKEGFTVERGSGGMPTAFCAEWKLPGSPNNAPMIGLYAEYDAVPANCQAASTRQEPRQGLGYEAGGHTDPHSALGTSGLAGALATKSAMEKHGIPGGIRFTGEPAEKVRGSKPIHAALGYYDGLAAILSFHPFYMIPLCNTVRWDTHCGAAYSFIYRFRCDEPERWLLGDGSSPIPQAHSAARAPGANDALVQMYSSSRLIRDSMLPHQGGWSISEAILSTGQATADNLPATLADLQYLVRVPTLAMAEQVTAALDANADLAAKMTGCTVEKHWVTKSRPGLANHAMAELVWEAMQEIGPPIWDKAACDLANEIRRELGLPAEEKPFLDACETLIAPQEAERLLRQDLPPSQLNSTSDDYTDMTWHAPTARFYVARPALELPIEKGAPPYPSWVMNALGGIPQTIDPMVQVASKILAVSALRLIEDETARAEAKREFETRTGGGVGGSKWTAPLCDYEPPIHFAWPEYVETARGRDWHIPSG